MASAEVNFDLRELDGLAKLLEKAKLSSSDRGRLLKNIGAEVEVQTQERFDTRRDPEGNPWKKLAQKTRDYYLSKGLGGGSLLVQDGGLRDSIESRADDWSVLVGATKVYAAIHQFGGEIRPKSKAALFVPGYGMLQKVNIPARPYLGISASNAEDIMLTVRQFLAERVTEKAS
jgi:phage virion morphogenesis protein